MNPNIYPQSGAQYPFSIWFFLVTSSGSTSADSCLCSLIPIMQKSLFSMVQLYYTKKMMMSIVHIVHQKCRVWHKQTHLMLSNTYDNTLVYWTWKLFGYNPFCPFLLFQCSISYYLTKIFPLNNRTSFEVGLTRLCYTSLKLHASA